VKRRFLRIWPGLIAVTVLGAFVLGPLVTNLSASDYFRAGETAHYFKTLLLNIKYYLPGVFINNPYPRAVNGSLWTIPVEVHWYVVILVAGVVGLLRFRHFVFAALVVLAIYYLGIYGAESNPKRIYFQEFGLFFLYGACLHLYQEQWRKHVALTALFLICSALIALFFGHPLVALWLVLPFLVIVFGTASTPVIRRFGRFGDLSYGIYIYAFPVQQTVAWLTSARYSLTATLGLSAAITTLFAFASWHLIERPALSFKPRQSGR